jgi:hypothetical protein
MMVVMVADVLKAIHAQRNLTNATQAVGIPSQVYGFGYVGGIRGLLGENGILQVLHQIHPNLTIDEIALSVVHDMIVSMGVDVIKRALNGASTVVCRDGAYLLR